MAIAVDQNYDKAQRKISTDNLAQFAGVDCQLLVEKETHRPIIMDGSTIGGKFKCASTDEVKAVETVANNAISQAYADEHYLGKTAKAISANTADTANIATKATQDANGNVIPDTYATKTELTSGLATKQPVGDYRTKSELDSIYLGINAKAKSAKTADFASTINSEAVVGNVGVQGDKYISATTNPCVAAVDSYATVYMSYRNRDGDGKYNYRFIFSVDGVTYATEDREISANAFDSVSFSLFVRKGQKLSGSLRLLTYNTDRSLTSFSVKLSPISLYAISEEESE